MNLQEKAKNFPLGPGVYQWLDKKGEILYVGRATSLRRRVLQYFRKDIDARIMEMVDNAKDIKFKETETVLESVILEANLIKKYWPKYNIKDRDDRSFIFIVIPKEDFPRPLIVRGRELAKFPRLRPLGATPGQAAKVFGPYSSQTVVRNALKIIRRIFPYSTCRPTGKPCFEYQIGTCPGVCVGAISKDEYKKNIDSIILLLSGEKARLIKKLSKENPQAALALKHIQDVTLISREEFSALGDGKFNRIEGFDISHFAGKETYGSMVVFVDGQPDKNEYRLFKIRTATNNDLESMKEVVARRLKHPEWARPDIIMIDGGKPQVDYIAKYLDEQHLAIPMLGISKLHGDKLVFPPSASKSFKNLAQASKNIFIKVRDEAHRFAIKAHRKGRSKSMVQ